MSYRVLARAYRSNTFDEVVGQEAIATTFKNAIASGRIHHGYLFTGTRGVGKTSMARIVAKSLNCLAHDAPVESPCCQCDSCLAVAEGEDVDVIEIDAASNTGVDNIRELRSHASFRPARSRFKVYIVDEVHMLSTGAFNALLKTLEEPPPHVKFILATTEPEKVPATIQSRCQRFDFRAISVNDIAEHLKRIVASEKIIVDEDVLRRVARLANGSMRDALSLLDKLLSYEPTHLTASIADEIIPPPHDELAAAVMEAVSQNDAAGALQALDAALQTGRTVDRFCEHLINHVRTLMLLRVCGDKTELVDVAEPMRPSLVAQASRFDGPTYVYMVTLLEELRRSVRFSSASRALADAAIVRLAMSRQFTDIQELLNGLGDNPPSPQGRNVATTEDRSKKKDALSVGGRAQATQGQKSSDFVGGAGSSNRPSTVSVTPATASPSEEDAGLCSSEGASVSQPIAKIGVPARRLSSEEWDRAARDPFVQRVKEAVEGTLFDIRPARANEPETEVEVTDAHASPSDENASTPIAEE